METLMVVGCDPLPGRSGELNNWYNWVHVRDVMRLPGSMSAQRFVLSPIQPAATHQGKPFTYLALYEIADKAACNKGHKDHCFTDRMPISSAFDFEAFHEAYFDPVGGANQQPSPESAEQSVMLIASDLNEEQAGQFEGMLARGGLTAITALPGVSSAAAFRFGTDQMMNLPARHSHFVLSHLSDLSLAVACWERFVANLPETWRSIEGNSLRADVYLPLMRRLQAKDVLAEPPHVRDIAARARAALGNRVHHPGSNQFM